MTQVRLMLFQAEPGSLSKMKGMVDKFDGLLRQRKGFKGVTFFGDDLVGEYGSLVQWESKEDADAAAEALSSELQKDLSEVAKGPPKLSLYEVYEPQS